MNLINSNFQLYRKILFIICGVFCLLFFSNCQLNDPFAKPAVEINKLADVALHQNADSFCFQAYADTNCFAKHTWYNRGAGKTNYTKPANEPDPFAMWVLPVFDNAENSQKMVHAWITPLNDLDGVEEPTWWFLEIKEHFNGKKVKGKVMVRIKEKRDSGWEKAVKIAEDKYGLTSSPEAVVIAWQFSERKRR